MTVLGGRKERLASGTDIVVPDTGGAIKAVDVRILEVIRDLGLDRAVAIYRGIRLRPVPDVRERSHGHHGEGREGTQNKCHDSGKDCAFHSFSPFLIFYVHRFGVVMHQTRTPYGE